jgi:hypothetical protein
MDLTLVKKDFRELRTYIFNENDINNWDKIIILYNFYLFFNHLYILYILFDYISHSKESFTNDFKSIYLFFFILCNLKNSYLYFILNVSKMDVNLGNSIYNNTKEYFI